MAIHVLSGCLLGVDGVTVQVEVDVLSQLPCFSVVGLPQSSVREARERVRSAIDAVGLPFPRRRITVNLAPADLPKSGTGLDLPIALGVVAAAKLASEGERSWDEAPLAIGELGLDGRLRPVRGVLAIVEAAARNGVKVAIVAGPNAPEAALVPGIKILAVHDLKQAWDAARGKIEPIYRPGVPIEISPLRHERGPDLADVQGLKEGRRALEICAAGGHGLLLEGPPGSGKSMLSKRLAGLLPDLSDEEALVVTRIHSAAGMHGELRGLIRRPPLRAPHHTASTQSIVGGGRPVRPGEVSLAHNGVLFLDELPEFPRGLLESLRQPMEDRRVTITRTNHAAELPADFQLIATRNPCPCGLLGAKGLHCQCLLHERERYRGRISGPLLDRIDLVAWVEPEDSVALLRAERGESSAAVRERVVAARHRQRERWGGQGFRPINASAPMQLCLPLLTSQARRRLESALRQMRQSARGVQQLLRVGCTVADLEGSRRVEDHHIQEAFLLCTGDVAPGPSEGRLVRRLRKSRDAARASHPSSLSPRRSTQP